MLINCVVYDPLMHNADYLLQKLKKKGWSDEELTHAGIIFSEHQKSHHIVHPIYDKILHWVVYASIMITNIALFLFLMPIILLQSSVFKYLVMAVVAMIFGFTYNWIFHNMTHLTRKHHVLYSILMPIVTIISFLILYYYMRFVMSIPIEQVLATSIIYSLFLVIPFYFKQIRDYFINL